MEEVTQRVRGLFDRAMFWKCPDDNPCQYQVQGSKGQRLTGCAATRWRECWNKFLDGCFPRMG